MLHSEQMASGPIPRLLLKFSLPAIAGTMVYATYNVVNRIYLGYSVGAVGIAATSVAFPIMMILMALGMLVAHGANALISIRLGEKRPEEAEHLLGQAVMLLLLISVGFTAGGLLLLHPLLIAFGATPTILPAAEDYMRIILLGTLTHEISFAMNNFIRGEGNARIAMWTMLLGAGLNLILDPIFIFGCGWGVKGAALGTVLAQTVSAGWVLYYYFGGQSQLKIRWRHLRLRWASVKSIAALGSPPFTMQAAGCLVTALLNNQLRDHGGDIAISAMGVIFSCNTVFFMPILGVCMGMQPIIGYNHGAHQYHRVRQCLLLALGTATVFCCVGTLFVLGLPHAIVALFGKRDPELVAVGAHGMRICMLMMPVVGFQMVGAQYFQAVGRPRISLFLSMTRQVIVLAPLLLLLPPLLGLDGVWGACPIADFSAAAVTAFFVVRELRRLQRLAAAPGFAQFPAPA